MRYKDYTLDWELIKHMSEEQLTKITERYARAYRRRAVSLLASERRESYAYKTYIKRNADAPFFKKYRGKIKTNKSLIVPAGIKKLSLADKRAALKIFEKFLTAKTSTRQGIKEVEAEKIKQMQDLLGVNVSKRDADILYRGFAKQGLIAKEMFSSTMVQEAVKLIAQKSMKDGKIDRKRAKQLINEFLNDERSLLTTIDSLEEDLKNGDGWYTPAGGENPFL